MYECEKCYKKYQSISKLQYHLNNCKLVQPITTSKNLHSVSEIQDKNKQTKQTKDVKEKYPEIQYTKNKYKYKLQITIDYYQQHIEILTNKNNKLKEKLLIVENNSKTLNKNYITLGNKLNKIQNTYEIDVKNLQNTICKLQDQIEYDKLERINIEKELSVNQQYKEQLINLQKQLHELELELEKNQIVKSGDNLPTPDLMYISSIEEDNKKLKFIITNMSEEYKNIKKSIDNTNVQYSEKLNEQKEINNNVVNEYLKDITKLQRKLHEKEKDIIFLKAEHVENLNKKQKEIVDLQTCEKNISNKIQFINKTSSSQITKIENEKITIKKELDSNNNIIIKQKQDIINKNIIIEQQLKNITNLQNIIYGKEDKDNYIIIQLKKELKTIQDNHTIQIKEHIENIEKHKKLYERQIEIIKKNDIVLKSNAEELTLLNNKLEIYSQNISQLKNDKDKEIKQKDIYSNDLKILQDKIIQIKSEKCENCETIQKDNIKLVNEHKNLKDQSHHNKTILNEKIDTLTLNFNRNNQELQKIQDIYHRHLHETEKTIYSLQTDKHSSEIMLKTYIDLNQKLNTSCDIQINKITSMENIHDKKLKEMMENIYQLKLENGKYNQELEFTRSECDKLKEIIKDISHRLSHKEHQLQLIDISMESERHEIQNKFNRIIEKEELVNQKEKEIETKHNYIEKHIKTITEQKLIEYRNKSIKELEKYATELKIAKQKIIELTSQNKIK